ncbi:MAG: glycosyltransferase family 2 protein, partial [Planctomycetota bacterium]
MAITLAILSLLLSAFPALMFFVNLPLFSSATDRADAERSVDDGVSVLIPARDEETSIEACVASALASEGIAVEVVVLDDASEDRTAVIVRSIAEKDSRVKLIPGKPLPEGWNGKQHACKQLAEAATQPQLVFLDADVRLAPASLVKLAEYRALHEVALLSAFPHQVTG